MKEPMYSLISWIAAGDLQVGGYEPTKKLAIREGKNCKRDYETAYGERVRYAVYKHTRKRVK